MKTFLLNKTINKTIFAFMFIFIFLYGGYYFNDFSNPGDSNDFLFDYWYSKTGYTDKPNLAVSPILSDSVIVCSNSVSKLLFRRTPHYASNNNWTYNGVWIGNTLMLTNRTFSAASTAPFGFEVKRTRLNFDFDISENADRSQAEANIWLIERPALITNSWVKYMNMFMIFDNVNQNTGSIGRFGYYDGTPVILNLTNAWDALGRRIDLTDADYPLNHDYQSDNFSSSVPNTHHYTFRITHDGSYIRVYINPDPDNLDSRMPNEFCRVLEKPVNWNRNLTVMLGHESRSIRRNILIDYDHLLVRSVCEEASGFLDPCSKPGYYRIVIDSTVTSNDSGINVVECRWPYGKGNKLYLTDPPVIKIGGENITVLPLASSGDRTGESTGIRPVQKTCKNVLPNKGYWYVSEHTVTVILPFFAGKKKGNHASSKERIVLEISPESDPGQMPFGQAEVLVDGRQFDEFPFTHGLGATTGAKRVEGCFIIPQNYVQSSE